MCIRDSYCVEQRSVGREEERRALRAALAEVNAGRGIVIDVAGEPGMGKTTLVEAFLTEISSAPRPCRIARGRCSERLAGTEAYLPILEALEALTRGPGAASIVALMKRLAPTWYL